MSDRQQIPMFDDEEQPKKETLVIELDADTPLDQAIEVYVTSLQATGSSIYTVKAFKSDVNLLGKWAGMERPIGTFATRDLNQFLNWMLNERDKPCSPKTYARRVTTLKNFFGYLHDQEAIPRNPSLALIQRSVSSPLPIVLEDREIDRVLGATQQMRYVADNVDARPHLLVTLLLFTGIKKSECMALRPEDVDRSEPESPAIWVRYESPRLRYKERRILLEPDWPIVLEEYMAQRKPEDTIFDCTARNLEYVLRDVADLATVPRQKMSFEVLRWTCALDDYMRGMDQDRLRQKLGLSRISWRETSAKLQKLADQYS